MTEPVEQHAKESVGQVLSRLGPAAVLGLLWAVLPLVGLTLAISFAGPIADWLRARPVEGVWIYIACFAAGAGAGLLPTWIQAVIGGFAFSTARGFAAALTGFTLASLLAYLVATILAKQRVEREIASHPKARVIRDALVGRGFWSTLGIVTLIRLNSPFALTNLALATSGVRLPTYLLGTIFGLGPRTFIAVHIGSQLNEWNSPDKPRWLIIASVAVAIVVILTISQIAQNALKKFAGADASEAA